MNAIEIEARNKMLVIKGILAEKCGLSPDIYDELSRELDEFMLIIERNKIKSIPQVLENVYDPNCVMCHGTGRYSYSTFGGETTTTTNCSCNLLSNLLISSQKNIEPEIQQAANKIIWDCL